MQLKGANSVAASGLISRNNLVGTGRAISVFLAYMELQTSNLALYGLHIQRSRPIFQLWQVGISQEI